MILNSRNSLIDLSLNTNSVHFLEHSKFQDLNGNHSEDFDSIFPTAGQSLFTNDPQASLRPLLLQPSLVFKINMINETSEFL
jgi:hypothetical protein